MSCEFAHDDAAYVLGALPPAERLAFERHLTTCEECAEAVRELAGMPGLLARVPLDVAEGDPVPEPLPATLLPRLIDDVRRTQRRRRWLTGLAAAAAVAVVAVASVAVGLAVGDEERAPEAGPSAPVTTAPAQEMSAVGESSDAASISMTSVAWGTRLDLECRWSDDDHGDGGPGYDHPEDGPGGTYALVVRSSDGATQQVATWRSVPGRTTRVTAATSLDRADIVAIEVQTADGRPAFELAD